MPEIWPKNRLDEFGRVCLRLEERVPTHQAIQNP